MLDFAEGKPGHGNQKGAVLGYHRRDLSAQPNMGTDLTLNGDCLMRHGAVMLQGTTAVGSKPHIAMMLPEHCIDPLVLFGCRVENGFPDVSGYGKTKSNS